MTSQIPDGSLQSIRDFCEKKMEPKEKLRKLANSIKQNQFIRTIAADENYFPVSVRNLNELGISPRRFVDLEESTVTVNISSSDLKKKVAQICNEYHSVITRILTFMKAQVMKESDVLTTDEELLKGYLRSGIIKGLIGLADPVLDHFKKRPIPFKGSQQIQNGVFVSLLLFYALQFGPLRGYKQKTDAEICKLISDAIKHITDLTPYIPESHKKLLPIGLQKRIEKSQAKHVNLYQVIVQNIKRSIMRIVPKIQAYLAQLDASLKRMLGPIPYPFNQLAFHQLDLMILHRLDMLKFKTGLENLDFKIDDFEKIVPKIDIENLSPKQKEKFDKLKNRYEKINQNKRFVQLQATYSTVYGELNKVLDLMGKSWNKMFVPYLRKNKDKTKSEEQEAFCVNVADLLVAYGQFLVCLALNKNVSRYFPEIIMPSRAFKKILNTEGLTDTVMKCPTTDQILETLRNAKKGTSQKGGGEEWLDDIMGKVTTNLNPFGDE
jgi:hypothetical protein